MSRLQALFGSFVHSKWKAGIDGSDIKVAVYARARPGDLAMG